ncbi:thiamine biosynthesis protein ThiC [Methanospirillum hungatei JF-1]|uniref:Thiamine biosynthesis protein ThiC n=1 Tax=Methanospirillum hungatei JF-1 (strain ATCC 27890 / DSM 864 / NBRC 100397 / JF-1) TaxID=323259 RepID=Q2FP19_METHJ|nr:phosphomethylpyrimidine synthase ThiC [Methanospirillum hungatei]ABD40897.1 thiamine biosynthesis protein ThiC [Methanospirillum hungatei JF-1]
MNNTIIKNIAEIEHQPYELIRKGIETGSIAIMYRGNMGIAIGTGLRTKINVNLGTSSGHCVPEEEIQKAKIAELYGADTITDLSTAGDIPEIRQSIRDVTSLPMTTVPLYQAVAENTLDYLTDDLIIENLKEQIKEDISSMVLHCPSRQTIKAMKQSSRIMGVVSKGGAMMSSFMLKNNQENPYITHFDEILTILKSKDVVLSLGNTMRTGCIHDNRDSAQVLEINENILLAQQAHEKGVQVIIEGAGGHIRADKIAENIRYYKDKTDFPLFVAGPLPADVGMGYDHITGAIGATFAAGAGADYLCYITRAEHKSLPTPDEVKEGLIAFRIAAHIGDSMKYGLSEKDKHIAEKRAQMNFEEQAAFALDPEEAGRGIPMDTNCSMCGSFCALKMIQTYCRRTDE